MAIIVMDWREWRETTDKLVFQVGPATTSDEIQFRHKRHWGYIYRPYYAEISQDLS